MTVVFLHAFPLDPRMWEHERMLVPGSEAPLLYELGETMDDWAAAILDRYPGELVLVGASMGGYLAYHVARLAPERVRGLLTEGSRAQADTPGGRARRDELIALTRAEGMEALWEAMRPALVSPTAGEELVGRVRAWVVEQDPDHAVRALRAMRDRRDHTDVLQRLEPRPIVVLGELDATARPTDFNGVLPEEALRVVPGSGHLPSLERPEAFRTILEEALAWTR